MGPLKQGKDSMRKTEGVRLRDIKGLGEPGPADSSKAGTTDYRKIKQALIGPRPISTS